MAASTEESAQLALRTQQILAYETGIPDVVDPLAGSYYIESLTSEIEEKTFDLIKYVDELGGAISSIENNFQQNEISNTSYDYQKKVESKDQIIVGNNQFVEQNKDRSIAFTSMGHLNYLSTLQFVDGVVGNSSSGLAEVPTFKIGTINIGDRQKGRKKSTKKQTLSAYISR